MAMEVGALDLRETALELVLMGLVQAVFAAAADMAVAGSFHILGRHLATVADLFGANNAWCLCYVVDDTAVVATGHYAGGYIITGLVLGYVLVAVSYAALLGVSLTFTCC